MHKNKTYLILHNIRSVQNVGSIFRTADAAGVSKIILTGYTPTPVDRFGRTRKDVSKTALGAEEYVKWEYRKSPTETIKKLKTDGFYVAGIEQAPRAVNYKHLRPKEKIAFLFGNEVRGLSQKLLKHCDTVAEIPMQGKKESLNVSVAVGIVLFEFF